jgi:tRNA 2-thiouridine synthesizing protein A
MSDDALALDARGLLCPLPVIRLHALARHRPAGTRIQILATDPGVRQDIPAWCRVHGHAVAAIRDGREIEIDIVLGDPPPRRTPRDPGAPI